jgi:hypothetical protein
MNIWAFSWRRWFSRATQIYKLPRISVPVCPICTKRLADIVTTFAASKDDHPQKKRVRAEHSCWSQPLRADTNTLRLVESGSGDRGMRPVVFWIATASSNESFLAGATKWPDACLRQIRNDGPSTCFGQRRSGRLAARRCIYPDQARSSTGYMQHLPRVLF